MRDSYPNPILQDGIKEGKGPYNAVILSPSPAVNGGREYKLTQISSDEEPPSKTRRISRACLQVSLATSSFTQLEAKC